MTGRSSHPTRRVPQRGDVYWIDPNPVAGREMKDRHRFVVVTPSEINKLGVAITVPITSGGAFARLTGLTVPILGHDTSGVAVCNQARSFDIQARVLAGSARFIETLDEDTAQEIVSRLLSVLDPA
jgi:mRNA interferase ChpB